MTEEDAEGQAAEESDLAQADAARYGGGHDDALIKAAWKSRAAAMPALINRQTAKNSHRHGFAIGDLPTKKKALLHTGYIARSRSHPAGPRIHCFTLAGIVEVDGEPWFVAKDVCEVLELSNTTVALRPLDEDEKGVSKGYTLGGTQGMTRHQRVRSVRPYRHLERQQAPVRKE